MFLAKKNDEKKEKKKKTPGLWIHNLSLHRDEREKPYKCRTKSKDY